MRLPVRRPEVRVSISPLRWSAISSTGISIAMISETRHRGNFAPSPPPSPVECHAPNNSAVGDVSSSADASLGFASARRKPTVLFMNGSPSSRLSRMIAS